MLNNDKENKIDLEAFREAANRDKDNPIIKETCEALIVQMEKLVNRLQGISNDN